MTLRNIGYSILALLVLGLVPSESLAGDLRVAAWNLEHLDDADGEGCIGRSGPDYAALARSIVELGADIVAFQEVENAAAAHRVFPASDWHVEMSGRPPMQRSRACWGKPRARLGHLATGLAIRREVAYRRNEDLKALGGGQAFQRWGTDVTVMAASGSRSPAASWGQALNCVFFRCILRRGAGAGNRTGTTGAGKPARHSGPRSSVSRHGPTLAGPRGPPSSSWAISTAGWRSRTTGSGLSCRHPRRPFSCRRRTSRFAATPATRHS